MDTKILKLILIRHGETDYNAMMRYCGFSDPPLNAKGKFQAVRLAERLRNLKSERVIASNLQRAYQTAAILFGNRHVETDANFREMNFGIFEGLKHEEIMVRHAYIYRHWIEDQVNVSIPCGESVIDLNKRVMESLGLILKDYENRDGEKIVAIVTHGGPIRVIMCWALKYGLKRFWEIGQANTALNIIDFKNGYQATVRIVNDTNHLLNEGGMIFG